MMENFIDNLFNKDPLFYSVFSAFTFFGVIFVLLCTDYYLRLGKKDVLPFFVVIISFEFLKWWFYARNQGTNILQKKNVMNTSLLCKTFNFKDCLKSIGKMIMFCIGCYIISVLFGAELLAKQMETLMFSVLITILSCVPLCIQLGSAFISDLLQNVKPHRSFDALIIQNSQAAFIGAWFGAFVIPLDWDRPWQVWPVPCSLGAIFGYTLSNCLYLLQRIFNYELISNKVI